MQKLPPEDLMDELRFFATLENKGLQQKLAELVNFEAGKQRSLLENSQAAADLQATSEVVKKYSAEIRMIQKLIYEE
jgi:hypothetical protein